MTIVYLLLPMALLMAFCFLSAFIWAAQRGQFDDLETPALRILMDDPVVEPGRKD